MCPTVAPVYVDIDEPGITRAPREVRITVNINQIFWSQRSLQTSQAFSPSLPLSLSISSTHNPCHIGTRIHMRTRAYVHTRARTFNVAARALVMYI